MNKDNSMYYKYALRELIKQLDCEQLQAIYSDLRKEQYENRAEDGNTAYQENIEISLVLEEIASRLKNYYGVEIKSMEEAIGEFMQDD